jgi:hypothetical protein
MGAEPYQGQRTSRKGRQREGIYNIASPLVETVAYFMDKLNRKNPCGPGVSLIP